ncbi:DJ-1/PfpI family protein [Candidatus Fermentibacteria bacterium]|nr:DJ-1/PfpI family protein [Candidatus Fermentibacteria bacterium]
MVRMLMPVVVLVISLVPQVCAAVEALVIVPQHYGANAFFYLNDFRLFGWHITITGTADTIAACAGFAGPLGCPPLGVDLRLDEITDITAYDVVAIMSSAQPGTSPAQDLLNSPHALDLIHTAVDSGLAVAAWCASVRVLAAADVLDGVSVTGSPAYQSEYEAAGATFVGGNHYPVVDENIVTCARGRYFHQENANAVARALECSRRSQRHWGATLAPPADQTRNAQAREEPVWSTTLGGSGSDLFVASCHAPDGGVAALGLTHSQGSGLSDVLLALFASDGSVLWSRTYGGSGWESGEAICPAQGGGYLLAGSTTSSGAGGRDILLLRVDQAGNEVWSRTFGGTEMDRATSVAQGSDGSIVVAGYTESYGAGEDDVFVVKTDANGAEIWTRTMGSSSSERSGAISPTADGGYVMTGSTGGFGAANRDVWLVKLREDGSEEWFRIYDGVSGAPEAAMDEGHAVVQMADGGYAVAGVSDRPIPTSAGDLLCAFLIRTDHMGTELWRRRYGENSLQDHARSLVMTDDALIMAGATTDATTARTAALVIATDLEGNELWRCLVDDEHHQWGNAVSHSPTTVCIAGYAESYAGDMDAWVAGLSTLRARFGATPRSGHAPLPVQFLDQSLGEALSWSWDLDGDGMADSDGPDPLWTYAGPGVYPVTLTVGDGAQTSIAFEEDFIRVFDGESALEFNGQSGSAICAASPSLSVVDAVTAEALIKPCGWGEATATGYGRIVEKTSFGLYLHGQGPTYNDQSLLFMVKNESGPPRICASPANSLMLDRWQHVAVVYDAVAGVALFIDGESQEVTYSTVPSGPLRDNAGMDLIIGNTAADSYTFDGIIDEVRVWRVARSADEIQDARTRYLNGDEDGLAGYWRMNEGSGDWLGDLSPNGNTAAIAIARWAQGGLPAGVADHGGSGGNTPSALTLLSIAPNPFTDRTAVALQVRVPLRIEAAVFDVAGRRVRRIMRGELPAGRHVLAWNGRDDRDVAVAPGPYVWVVRGGDGSFSTPVVMNR